MVVCYLRRREKGTQRSQLEEWGSSPRGGKEGAKEPGRKRGFTMVIEGYRWGHQKVVRNSGNSGTVLK